MAESEVIAVTGKPLADYEPFVEILAAYGANVLALATTDTAWLASLDRSVTLDEALKDDARETIRWRLAHHIDELKAQLAAELTAGSLDQKLPADAETVNLGGAVGLTTKDYYEMSYQVPSYPNIILEFSDPKAREGYLIQNVPGGFRYISIDLPDFELQPDGSEIQLPAPDEFGPTMGTIEEAAWSAWNHFHEQDISDDYRPWSRALADVAKRAESYEAP